MRIKFRAWDIRKNVMREVVVIHFNEASNVSGASYWSEDMELKSLHGNYIKLMQYTGLKDSNGVEIYEGDVVRVTHDEYFIDEVCTVVWGLDNNDTYPAFHMPELDTESNSFSEVFNVDGYFVKVIGNIYQNKELLEGE
ncbi:phage related protein [Brochothrix thermosphacta]|uniref:YopX family protein n=1 Tax=Brochothrix thermosphacta TaxID=2756 RepID=UPI00083FA371|nr:YopX family protein [Brochothrix thermosphacta]ODJ65712.1 hypothetical protein BFR37_10120 [Brochothrix thermosphacta]SPN72441.1 phage related protein [Brochothrix thermosphacta]